MSRPVPRPSLSTPAERAVTHTVCIPAEYPEPRIPPPWPLSRSAQTCAQRVWHTFPPRRGRQERRDINIQYIVCVHHTYYSFIVTDTDFTIYNDRVNLSKKN